MELLFSLGKWFSFSTRINLFLNFSGEIQIFLPKSVVSLEFHEGGYVKKATQKQRFAQCVDIDLSMVFLNFGQLLFSNLSSQIDGFSRNPRMGIREKKQLKSSVLPSVLTLIFHGFSPTSDSCFLHVWGYVKKAKWELIV